MPAIVIRSCALLFLLCHLVWTAAHAADAVRRTLELTIAGNVVPENQRVLRAAKGDVVTLRVSSDVPGELHIHAYRQEVKLSAAGTVELVFTAHASGRYRIEWHAAAQRRQGGHHDHPFAMLEVRPRP